MGRVLQKRLRDLNAHPLVGEVRGVGLIAGVELVADKATKARFDTPGKVGAYVFARAHHHGLIVRNILDTIAFCPPLIITESQIEDLVQAFERTLNDTAEWIAAGQPAA